MIKQKYNAANMKLTTQPINRTSSSDGSPMFLNPDQGTSVWPHKVTIKQGWKASG